MKILLITDNHTPTGGAENYFFELKSKLQALNLTVYSIGFGKCAAEGKDFTIFKSAASHLTKLCGQLFFHPYLYRRLVKKIARFAPDVIHLHNNKQFTPTVFKAIQGYPVLQTVHDFSYLCPNAQNIHRDLTVCETGLTWRCFWQHQVKYNRLIFLAQCLSFYHQRQSAKQTIKHYIAPSPFLAAYLEKSALKPVTYLPPFKKSTMPVSFSESEATHFLFAGAIGAHKGIFLLLEEFRLACQRHPALKLTIAGEGSELGFLKERIAELNLTHHVAVVGWQKDLAPYYDASAALIFPSTGLESFGLVITEAMRHARPVIGINRGTAAWLIEDEVTGLLFNPHQRGDLAQKIVKLALNKSLIEKLGRNAQQKLERLIDNDKVLQELVMLYQKLIKKGRL